MKAWLSANGIIEAGAIQAGSRTLTVKVENFGLAKSSPTNVQLRVHAEAKEPGTFTASLSALDPYEASSVRFRVLRRNQLGASRGSWI